MSQYLTPDEVDDLLKLPQGKAKRLAKRGKLPAVTLADGTIRFDAEVLRAFLANAEAAK